ncbi:hypothetical protein ACLF3G_11260 [Falsiroseomonas sp. HC035]|uniref:hypothetical protein n=1 Tax=Falsiroseomonas sp. HC035 TaxID=3390999 RepID=UPI003D310A7D
MSFELFRTASNPAPTATFLREDRETILRFGTQLLDAGEAARRAALIAATLPMPANPLATVPRPSPRDPAAAEATLVEEDEPFLVEEPETGTASTKGGRRKSAASTNPRRNVIEGALAGAALPESPRTIIAAGTLDEGGFRAVSFSAGATLAATSLAGAMLSVAVAQTPQETARLEMAGSFLATWKATQDFLAEGVQGRMAQGSALMPLEEIALAAPARGAPVVLTVAGSEFAPGAGAPGLAAPATRPEEVFEFSPRRPTAGEALQVDSLARDRDPVTGRSADPAPAIAEPQGAAPAVGTQTQGVMAPAVAVAPPVVANVVDQPAPTVLAPVAYERSGFAQARDLPGGGLDRPADPAFNLPIPETMPAVVVVARPRPEASPPKPPPAVTEAPGTAPARPEAAEQDAKPTAAVPVVPDAREKIGDKPDPADTVTEVLDGSPPGLDQAPGQQPDAPATVPVPDVVTEVLDGGPPGLDRAPGQQPEAPGPVLIPDVVGEVLDGGPPGLDRAPGQQPEAPGPVLVPGVVGEVLDGGPPGLDLAPGQQPDAAGPVLVPGVVGEVLDGGPPGLDLAPGQQPDAAGPVLIPGVVGEVLDGGPPGLDLAPGQQPDAPVTAPIPGVVAEVLDGKPGKGQPPGQQPGASDPALIVVASPDVPADGPGRPHQPGAQSSDAKPIQAVAPALPDPGPATEVADLLVVPGPGPADFLDGFDTDLLAPPPEASLPLPLDPAPEIDFGLPNPVLGNDWLL